MFCALDLPNKAKRTSKLRFFEKEKKKLIPLAKLDIKSLPGDAPEMLRLIRDQISRSPTPLIGYKMVTCSLSKAGKK
ncbi:hypothetical protein NECAME_18188 [Necator americanus]|uniref:Uncharacterized protein n=1 Tax=Necator americanus TaxID=51031 RepID=W2T9L1_NECAM|nr:hypothetical protein NECAME_18188 [Necator americanus]ETN78720.1 hypothetical protein NECAME_18188 [Necator americanus]